MWYYGVWCVENYVQHTLLLISKIIEFIENSN